MGVVINTGSTNVFQNGLYIGVGPGSNLDYLTAETPGQQNTLYLPNVEFGQLMVVGTGSYPATAGGMATVNLTGNSVGTATFSAQNLTNGTNAGWYIISFHAIVTAAGSGGTSVTFTTTYTTDGGSISPLLGILQMGVGGNLQTTTRPIYLASGNITWTASGYVNGTYVARVRMIYTGA